MIRFPPLPPAMILIQVSFVMLVVLAISTLDQCSGLWETYLIIGAVWIALAGGISCLVPWARGTWKPDVELFGHGNIYLLTTVIWVTIVFVMGYATVYLNASLCDPASFNEPLSKIDAIYFALTTLTTVGYGDIFAQNGFARAIVSTQLIGTVVFAIFVVGVLVNIVTQKSEGKDR